MLTRLFACAGSACVLFTFTVMVNPATAADWSGPYIGANLGYAKGRSDAESVFTGTGTYFAAVPNLPADTNTRLRATLRPDGVIGGVQGGYNWKSGNAVIGIEIDVNAYRLSEARTFSATYAGFPAITYAINQQVETDWMASVRPRIGLLASENLLVYGTAGLAMTRFHYNHSFNDNQAGFLLREVGGTSKTKYGFTIGAGIEYQFARKWSAKLEYLYTDFGGMSATGIATTVAGNFSAPTLHTANLSTHAIRVGFNYKF